MFLRRVQVPDFRVLKDVDITFEPEFSPRIFPLGSLNGGGKSTLLQLIFILLSCSGDPEKHFLIQNMLEGFNLKKGENQKPLATIYLLNNNQDIKLQFVCHKNEIHSEKIILNHTNEDSGETILRFSILETDKKIEREICELKNEIESLKKEHIKLSRIKQIENIQERSKAIKKELETIKYGSLGALIKNALQIKMNYQDVDITFNELSYLEERILNTAKQKQATIKLKEIELEEVKINLDKISTYLKKHSLSHICNYNDSINDSQKYALLYHSNQPETKEIKDLLNILVNRIFLAAPFTQIFHFMSKENSKLLFKDSDNKHIYYSRLKDIKSKLSNLFTYDLLSVDYIIDAFKQARDEDFKQAIESGEYGNAYKDLLNELNYLLGDKKINLDVDLSGVNFKISNNGTTEELYPEDLSHGELKRLSIYVWLKYKQISDSIILMDEIENAFHPDWQYQIINDLTEWGESNQYILATHSYELCQALTPAHVKELEPKLLPSKQVEN